MKIALTILLGIIALIIVYAVVASTVLFFTAIKKPKNGYPILDTVDPKDPVSVKKCASAEWFLAQKPEDITITSFDGIPLSAYFLPAEQGEQKAENSILLMHGYHCSGLREYGCIYDYFHSIGWNVLLPDQRSHGRSGGKYLTFGIKERYDVQKWAEYLDKRTGGKQKLWLMGISMGCSSVLMSLGQPLPLSVKGIIADCGYTSPSAIINCVVTRDFHLIKQIVMPVAEIFTKRFSDFDMKGYSTLTALKTNKIPILFVHGNKDAFVPFEMSKENYAACTAPKMFLETGAAHARSFVCEPEKYKAAITKFVRTYSDYDYATK